MKDIKNDSEQVPAQPPTDESVRELIVSLSNGVQQLKQMYSKVPKFDLLKNDQFYPLGMINRPIAKRL